MTEQAVIIEGLEDFTQGWSNVSDDDLLASHGHFLRNLAYCQEHLGRTEQEIQRRMNERKASAIPSEEFICEMEVKDTYSQPGFTPLKEIFFPADLAACFTPSHEETVQVADRWETAKVKALAKRYGEQALRVVEAARIPGPPKLKFRRKEKAD